MRPGLRRLLPPLLCCSVLAPAFVAAPAQAALPTKRQWLADVDRAMYGSKVYVQRRVDADNENGGGLRLALNLDIDNTSLASHYDPGEPVGRVLRLTDMARSRGVVLLFNTGRVEGHGSLARAERQLRDAGYVVTEICGRTSSRESLEHSKKRCRQRFADQGYTLIANIGNRITDFRGRDYGRPFMLPSYHNQLG